MSVTERALRSLLDKNLVYLCWFRHRDNEEQPLAKRDAERLVADPSRWESPLSDERYIAFAATPAGERAWQRSKPPVGESVG